MHSCIKDDKKGFISEYFNLTDLRITMDSNIFKDLWLDQMDLIELVMECEKQYEIAISDTEADRVQTVNDMVQLIVKTKHK